MSSDVVFREPALRDCAAAHLVRERLYCHRVRHEECARRVSPSPVASCTQGRAKCHPCITSSAAHQHGKGPGQQIPPEAWRGQASTVLPPCGEHGKRINKCDIGQPDARACAASGVSTANLMANFHTPPACSWGCWRLGGTCCHFTFHARHGPCSALETPS